MSNLMAIAITALSIALGGYGLYQVAFKRGYVVGYDDAKHPDEITFTSED